ncbi:Sterile alpha motif domain-containing protein 15 [Clonorchis sinensis]|uniref:Sterile alpha motif domain-containing protein 15 n=1 Tax=Clonorchis sinensis TaxID=79923 RepID=A0A3R7C7P3_CLOSI|nr:Sterile alpha motif domain-containing protein 15 [Clonorchis sinensis]
MGDLSHIYDVCLSTTIPNASTWTVDDVCQWITDLGFPYYKDCMSQNFVDGKRLIQLQASALPQMGITKFEHIQIITKSIRDLLQLEEPNHRRTIRLPPRNFLGMFLESKSNTGSDLAKLSFPRFVYHTCDRTWKPPLTNEGLIYEHESYYLKD